MENHECATSKSADQTETLYFSAVDEFSAAHHEAAHAVVGVSLGLPLLDDGIHLDTVDGGITFNLHRKPGDPKNNPVDVQERERSIIMIKAGYRANLKLFADTPATVAADDRREEIALLNEMYAEREQGWRHADARLTAEAQTLVEKHWDAIRALARTVLAKPIRLRSAKSLQKWSSPYPNEKWIDGYEIASILNRFSLNAIVRTETEGTYLDPALHPES